MFPNDPNGTQAQAAARTSPKERTRALRSLDRDGFITRDADAESPGYSLTPIGQSVVVLLDVYAWTAEHWDQLVDARMICELLGLIFQAATRYTGPCTDAAAAATQLPPA